ncbi:MAG: DUF86 domain-containing protein [Nanoarchaeota archaeon]|nr:DUF86 domain-containing protein [Nanoarchaeota archaeon]MBU4300418.1 DUF86 domain-containing protein [Nanoarchaeota archaeon]MBU4451538.1 DUF86 domain-containing protein [Nanoarchaeota archaeon]MCG2724024.1 DUF86 domain-containing protein [archaeon]
MKKDPAIFIKHILESIRNVESFSLRLSKSEFETDKMRQSAIIREIEIVGEAAKNLPVEFTAKYPQIKWSAITGTRDKLAHNYFGVDMNVVWDVVKYDLPELKAKMEKILKELEKEAK